MPVSRRLLQTTVPQHAAPAATIMFRDFGTHRNSSGASPWRSEAGSSTVKIVNVPEGGGLQQVSLALAAQRSRRTPSQFVVDEWHELLTRVEVALVPCMKERRDVGGAKGSRASEREFRDVMPCSAGEMNRGVPKRRLREQPCAVRWWRLAITVLCVVAIPATQAAAECVSIATRQRTGVPATGQPAAAPPLDAVIAKQLPGWRVAQRDDISRVLGDVSKGGKPEYMGDVAIQADFDGDNRQDWAAIVIDEKGQRYRAYYVLNLTTGPWLDLLFEQRWTRRPADGVIRIRCSSNGLVTSGLHGAVTTR